MIFSNEARTLLSNKRATATLDISGLYVMLVQSVECQGKIIFMIITTKAFQIFTVCPEILICQFSAANASKSRT